ncbi:hypothetical protein V7159_24320 [Priestia megaterium]|uniref:hypothetical protein n=1 Tax=Priestia megaterium TaxID=1404 RepID=UPI003009D232
MDTCSFDYPSGKFLEITGTQVFCTNCHLEGEGDAFTFSLLMIGVNGGTLVLKGGKFMMNSATPNYPSLADVQASSGNTKGGGLLIEGMFL